MAPTLPPVRLTVMVAKVSFSLFVKLLAKKFKRPCRKSLSMIVSEAVAMDVGVPPGSFAPPVALVRISATFSSNSTRASLAIGTWKVRTVWPGAKLSVPRTGVKSRFVVAGDGVPGRVK